jgi:hypothetical protein
MPRLVGLIIVLALSLGLAAWLARRFGSSNNQNPRNTFRPKRRSKQDQAPSDESDSSSYLMSRKEAETITDAFTGARINPQRRVWRCMGCQSMYHEVSLRALRKDLGRPCMNCESQDQRLVQFDPPHATI